MFGNLTRTGIAALALAAVVMLPDSAHAQRGGGHGRGGGNGGGNGGRTVIVTRPARPIVISPYVYSPYWQSYYNPYFWGFYGWGFPGFFGPTVGFGPYGGGVPESAARIQVNPRQTEVYVDGALAGIVDDFDGIAQRLRLPPGEHTLELYLDGFRPVSQTLHFVAGKTVNIKYDMQPLAPGEPAPQRPIPRTPPPSAQPNYDAFGQPMRTAPVSNGAGTLAIRVQPGDAVIIIDGERWHSSGTDRLDIQVGAGEHRIAIEKDGYQPFSTTVGVRPGETSSLNVSLSKGGE